jgi:RNA polymerase sigma factor (sigma-70 family)
MDLTEWVKLHADYLYAFALAKTGDAELSKDLVQDAFLAAHQNAAKYRGEAAPRTWLTSILRNKIADHFRSIQRKGRAVEMPAEDEDRFFENLLWKSGQAPEAWDESLGPEELLQYLTWCLEQLPERLRAVLRLKYLEATPTEHILNDLDLTAAHFWVLLHRSRLKMRACIEEQQIKTR